MGFDTIEINLVSMLLLPEICNAYSQFLKRCIFLISLVAREVYFLTVIPQLVQDVSVPVSSLQFAESLMLSYPAIPRNTKSG